MVEKSTNMASIPNEQLIYLFRTKLVNAITIANPVGQPHVRNAYLIFDL